MSSTELLILIGVTVVALVWLLALLTRAAILDGRYNEQQQQREQARRVRVSTGTLVNRAK
jgi:hypothetical protein